MFDLYDNQSLQILQDFNYMDPLLQEVAHKPNSWFNI